MIEMKDVLPLIGVLLGALITGLLTYFSDRRKRGFEDEKLMREKFEELYLTLDAIADGYAQMTLGVIQNIKFDTVKPLIEDGALLRQKWSKASMLSEIYIPSIAASLPNVKQLLIEFMQFTTTTYLADKSKFTEAERKALALDFNEKSKPLMEKLLSLRSEVATLASSRKS